MQQRVQMIRRRQRPSSTVQLPITAALHAENLTLLLRILHHLAIFVNPYFHHFRVSARDMKGNAKLGFVGVMDFTLGSPQGESWHRQRR